jgi:hypothetical protein
MTNVEQLLRQTLTGLADEGRVPSMGERALAGARRRLRRRVVAGALTVLAVLALTSTSILLLGPGVDRSATPTTATPTTADPTTFRDPPPSHAMSAAELSSAFAQCVNDSIPTGAEGFEPVLGRVFDESAPQRISTWVVAHKPGGPFDDLIVCAKPDADPIYSAFITESDTGTTVPYVRELVEEHVTNSFGRYTAPVVTITVAASASAPEVRAVLDRGYWFFAPEPYPLDTFPPDTTIIRGYDKDGVLLFDSRTVEEYSGCLADPTGTVVVMGADLNVPAEQCRRTYPWHFGP